MPSSRETGARGSSCCSLQPWAPCICGRPSARHLAAAPPADTDPRHILVEGQEYPCAVLRLLSGTGTANDCDVRACGRGCIQRANPVRTWRTTLGLSAAPRFLCCTRSSRRSARAAGTSTCGGSYPRTCSSFVPRRLPEGLRDSGCNGFWRGASCRAWYSRRPSGALIDTLTTTATLLNQVPPGKSVFPVIGDGARFGKRVVPYRHFAFWYTIRFHGNVPSLFDYSGDGMESNWFMPYFDDTAHRYAPPVGWFGGGGTLRPLNWQRIVAENDYVIVAGPRLCHASRSCEACALHERGR